MSDRVHRPASGSLASLIALAFIALLAVMPDLGPRVVGADAPVAAHHARIVGIGTADPDQPYRAPFARVLVLDGPLAGRELEAYLEGPGGSQVVADYQPGDEVVVTVTQDASGQPYIAVSDRWRLPLLTLVGLVFAAAVVLVGRARGLRALLALGLTIAVVLKVLVPLVIGGYAPVPLAVVTATFVTVFTILLTEGWTRASGAAILGTAGSLVLVGLLGLLGATAAQFTYSAGSDLAFLQTAEGRGLDLQGLLLAAFILGAVGVLDDVTVTQAALVERLAGAGRSGRLLVSSAMDVGRSHIAATVNTLFLAYVGVGLPLLVTIVISQQPAMLVFNSEEIATEIIRTVTGSIGILAAVPLTTLFTVALVDVPARRGEGVPVQGVPLDRLLLLGGVGLLVGLGLVATAVLPSGPPRAALPVEAFGPSAGPVASPGAPGAPGTPRSTEPPGTVPPDAGTLEPELLGPGDVYQLDTGSATVEVSVTDISVTDMPDGLHVRATIHYANEGPGDATVDPDGWALLAVDGTVVILEPPADDGLAPGDLGPGERRDGILEGTIDAPPDQVFVTFTDAGEILRFAVPVA